MKNKFIKTLSGIAGALAVFAVVMTAGSHVAFAGWNDASSGECPTVSVGNVTANNYGTVGRCWTNTSVSASVGDTINVKVYFHNNTTADASDVRIVASDSRNSSGVVQVAGSVHTTSGTVASGIGTISLPANTKLVYKHTVVQYQRDNYTIIDKGATTDIFGSGLQVGPIRSVTTDPQWGDQGVVKLVYTVESTGSSNQGQCYDNVDNDGDGLIDFSDPGCIASNGSTETNTVSGQIPLITTNSPTNLNSYDGTVRLNGAFNANGSSTTTCFDYQPIGGTIIHRSGTNQGGTQVGTFSDDLLNLTAGNYQYRACGFNSYGTGYGSWVGFYIGGGNNGGQYNNLTVTTLPYTNLDANGGYVTLRGQYYGLTYGTAYTYFEYRMYNGNSITTSQLSYSGNSQEFSQSLGSLSSGDYTYRACANNNGNVQCGSWYNFSINGGYINPPQNNQQPSVQTLAPFQISDNFVTFDGYYNMNGCSGTTYFEYGTSGYYGNRTNSISRSSSGSMAQSINGLTPSTLYYYRAVAQNCAGTVYGAQRSFTTSTRSTVIYDNTPIINTGTTVIRNNTVRTNTVRTVTTAIGTGSRFIRLTIDNHRDTVAKGDELAYDIEWQNISNQDLKDLVLEISIPESLQILSIERGQIDHKTNEVYVNISTLKAGEIDHTTIRAKVAGTLQSNESVTARAIMAFENPENKAQENAIAYDSDTYLASQNVLGASIFGLDFLPGTLAGWLFIILIIVLLILLIRYATGRVEQKNHYYHYPEDSGNMPPASVPPVTGTSTTTTVDYTPYRPTPKN